MALDFSIFGLNAAIAGIKNERQPIISRLTNKDKWSVKKMDYKTK